MLLRSDNVAGIAPEVVSALVDANAGEMEPYGDDPLSAALPAQFSDLFGADALAVPVVSGTAANALAIASIAGPHALIFCHNDAHCLLSECGSVEFFSPGTRLHPIAGQHGKIDPAALLKAIEKLDLKRGNSFIPMGLTLTQLTEAGTAYSMDELARLAEIARQFGLRIHMDGARLANATAFLKCDLAEITWRAGVDVVSFGGTKNGTMCADGVVFFNKSLAQDFKRRLKRSGHDLSKARFMAAQLSRYIQDGLWLRNAELANAAARELAEIFLRVPGAELLHPVEGNIIFLALPEAEVERLSARGVVLRSKDITADGKRTFRLVASFQTGRDFIQKVNRLIAI